MSHSTLIIISTVRVKVKAEPKIASVQKAKVKKHVPDKMENEIFESRFVGFWEILYHVFQRC